MRPRAGRPDSDRPELTVRTHISLTGAVLVAACLALLVGSAVPVAKAATCGVPVAYPGNKATSAEYANWMANGAVAAGLPGELPVMAALVESGLRNLNYGDRDSVGFFQMRKGFWDKGKYKGYLKKPDLQMQWFIDQARDVRAAYILKKKADPAASSSTYGVWIADIERPAAQYRGRYQLRLAEARALIKQTCPGLQGINITAPVARLTVARRQHPARSGQITTRVRCLDSACMSEVSGSFRLPGRRSVVKLQSDTAMIPAKYQAKIKLPLSYGLRKAVRKRLGRNQTTLVKLRIKVGNADGAANVFTRRVRIAR